MLENLEIEKEVEKLTEMRDDFLRVADSITDFLIIGKMLDRGEDVSEEEINLSFLKMLTSLMEVSTYFKE